MRAQAVVGILGTLLLWGSTGLWGQSSEPLPGPWTLWFNQPAAQWDDGLPIGNGRLGAMICGTAERERLALNEQTVWTGEDVDTHNPAAVESLKEVRRLLFEGRYEEAERLAQRGILAQRPSPRATYQGLGELFLEFTGQTRPRHYRRQLDLDTAVARVAYQANRRTRLLREFFATAVDQVLVVRLTASEPGALTFTARLARPGSRAVVTGEDGQLVLREHVGNGRGVRLVCRLAATVDGGRVTAANDGLQIDGADQVVLRIAAATDYWGQDPERVCRDQLTAALGRSYEQLLADHVADYQRFFRRVELDLGHNRSTYFPTDTRLAALRAGNDDPQLIALYFQFGRYLLISSSRPGGLPANLQGLWAEGLTPPWSADYHININIQMNYWPAEVTGLAELHEPFLRFIEALVPDGRKTARQVYDCNGAVAHYTTDAWHFTEPEGRVQYAMWPMGLAWCCQHLWEHYAFSLDRDFLAGHAYPVMKQASLFCLDWLVADPRTGLLVSGPSISPENRFRTPSGGTASLVMGPTMDHQIIRDLLTHTVAACDLLNRDPDLAARCRAALERLTPTQIGPDGRLLEWSEPFEEADPGHRHISHLFGLFPGDQITEQQHPELLAAARKTIDTRLAHGGGHTGWSRAWIINFFARLQDGQRAYENLRALLSRSTLPNLLDTHPPFQIDGNFGAVSGIVEMLLQSHAGQIHLLPALPAAWPRGHVRGLRARGAFRVDLSWDDARLTAATIQAEKGGHCQVRYGDATTDLVLGPGQSIRLNGRLAVVEP